MTELTWKHGDGGHRYFYIQRENYVTCVYRIYICLDHTGEWYQASIDDIDMVKPNGAIIQYRALSDAKNACVTYIFGRENKAKRPGKPMCNYSGRSI